MNDPLSPRARARAQRLERDVREQLGRVAPAQALPLLSPIGRRQLVANGADRRAVNELWHLHERGDAYFVYLVPCH